MPPEVSRGGVFPAEQPRRPNDRSRRWASKAHAGAAYLSRACRQPNARLDQNSAAAGVVCYLVRHPIELALVARARSRSHYSARRDNPPTRRPQPVVARTTTGCGVTRSRAFNDEQDPFRRLPRNNSNALLWQRVVAKLVKLRNAKLHRPRAHSSRAGDKCRNDARAHLLARAR